MSRFKCSFWKYGMLEFLEIFYFNIFLPENKGILCMLQERLLLTRIYSMYKRLSLHLNINQALKIDYMHREELRPDSCRQVKLLLTCVCHDLGMVLPYLLLPWDSLNHTASHSSPLPPPNPQYLHHTYWTRGKHTEKTLLLPPQERRDGI